MCIRDRLGSFSSTPVRRIWFSPSKHIVNINSWSGSPKLFHKSICPHHRFLIFYDGQVRSGTTLYWIPAFSVSAKVHFQNGNIYIARLLSFAESSNSYYEMHENQWRCAATFWALSSAESDIVHSTSWPLPFPNLGSGAPFSWSHTVFAQTAFRPFQNLSFEALVFRISKTFWQIRLGRAPCLSCGADLWQQPHRSWHYAFWAPRLGVVVWCTGCWSVLTVLKILLSLIHISEPTRPY